MAMCILVSVLVCFFTAIYVLISVIKHFAELRNQ